MPHTDGMTGKTRQLIKKIIYLAGITVAVYLGMRFALPIGNSFFTGNPYCKNIM